MADVRVNRGSMHQNGVMFSFAMSGQRTPRDGILPYFEPMIINRVGRTRSLGKVVEPPRPKLTPRPGTVEECQIRAWFSIYRTPSERNSFV